MNIHHEGLQLQHDPEQQQQQTLASTVAIATNTRENRVVEQDQVLTRNAWAHSTS
jgi:hypothetical protein